MNIPAVRTCEVGRILESFNLESFKSCMMIRLSIFYGNGK
jgi:hypothetical protein